MASWLLKECYFHYEDIMSSTRILKSIATPVSKLSSVGSIRKIYSCSHDQMHHWAEMHNDHTDGHKHYGALFVDHGIQGSRPMHSEPPHHTDGPKQTNQAEHTKKDEPPTFKAWKVSV